MKARFNRVPLYLTLALAPLVIAGCGESNDTSAVKPSPQPVASQPFPSPSVPPTLNSPSKIALTRPTNPDDRLRVIKSGRNDPFGSVGPIASVAPVGGSPTPSGSSTAGSSTGGSRTSTQDQVGNRMASSYEKFLKGIATGLGAAGKPSSGSLPTAGVDLPPLPKAPEPANVKVSGVVVVGGEPRAIVQVPDEPTSRTVGIGDALSGGRLIVKDINTSNRAEPMVVFQQGSIQFSVAVGREPILLASAPTSGAVRGLYSVQSR